MKITAKQLRTIIKEEIQDVMGSREALAARGSPKDITLRQVKGGMKIMHPKTGRFETVESVVETVESVEFDRNENSYLVTFIGDPSSVKQPPPWWASSPDQKVMALVLPTDR
jgi:hypothetical protein